MLLCYRLFLQYRVLPSTPASARIRPTTTSEIWWRWLRLLRLVRCKISFLFRINELIHIIYEISLVGALCCCCAEELCCDMLF